MKPVLAAVAAALICSIPAGAHAQSYAERLDVAMKEARWTCRRGTIRRPPSHRPSPSSASG